MNAVSVRSMGSRAILTGLVIATLILQVMPAAAQTTPAEACAADSLYLISPASVDLRLNTEGKPGMTISWPNLDLQDATCFSLKGTSGLGFDVAVDGGYNNDVDRVFRFSTPDSGLIGGNADGNITVSWLSQGQASNGDIGGVLNLANNGGFFSYDAAAISDNWAQINNGLPMTWLRTNAIATDRGTGDFILAAMTRGEELDSTPAGLFAYNGTNWNRLAADIFNSDIVITKLAISRDDNDVFAVGTDANGLFVTIDGGVTFTQWGSQLPSLMPTMATTFKVTALNWESERLLVGMPSWGLFISDDGGASFRASRIMVLGNLDDAASDSTLPTFNDFSVQTDDSDHIVAGLQSHGTFESDDGGLSWHDLYGTLLVPDPDGIVAAEWIYTAVDVLIDATNPQVIVMGVEQKGLYRTADGGATWALVGSNVQPAATSGLARYSLINRRGMAGEMLALEDGWSLLHSTDSGATWSHFADQPLLSKGLDVVSARDNTGDFIIGSNGGGIYEAGTTVSLFESYSTVTTAELRDSDLGLTIWFGEGGVVQPDDEFELVAQTFQGWAIFRGASHQRDEMVLVGLYDRVNPEDCFEGYCGDNSLVIIPQCFQAKRAACFDLSDADTLRFFDDEVYNGFSYVYSVVSFDYGNAALTTAQNNRNEMLFSPRWQGDTLSRYSGSGNRTRIDVNAPATNAIHDDEIYAYPNPIRLGAGVPGGEGRKVVFTNLPSGSRVRIFTTAGDDVINLGPGNQTGAQIYWNSINRDGEEVAAGVYLYKIVMPERDDFWGRIVVIR